MSDGCVVLMSGGQDSTTCAIIARKVFKPEAIWPVTFMYEQRHKIEVVQAQIIAERLGLQPPMVLYVPALKQLGGGALTNEDIPTVADAAGTQNKYAEEHNLPPTVVPGRNVVFLALAAGYGAKLGIYELWTGGCLADYQGYPDCRPEFYLAMQGALEEALDDLRVKIVTPLTSKSKAETFKIANDEGELDTILELTHTCYNGVREMHDWGAGCGECPACQVRAAGYQEFLDMPVVS